MAQIIEMQCKQSDGSYETLLQKSYTNLSEINNPDLGNHLGGNTTVEGALDYLSRIYAYWWKIVIVTPVYKFVETGDNYYVQLGRWGWDSYSNNSYNGSYDWATTDRLVLKSDGTIDMDSGWHSYTTKFYYDTRDKYFAYTQNDPRHGITLKYVKCGGVIYTSSQVDGLLEQAFYDAQYEGYYLRIMAKTEEYKCNTVTTALDHNEYQTDYVYSFSRNAYPDSGTVGNYTYTYLGIPFENAMKDGPK